VQFNLIKEMTVCYLNILESN